MIAHHDRAQRRRRIQPAVAGCAHAEDILREDRQKRRGRRKNVAKKSRSIVDRMSGDLNTNFSPSMAARSETPRRLAHPRRVRDGR
jgi:hypothetical protein